MAISSTDFECFPTAGPGHAARIPKSFGGADSGCRSPAPEVELADPASYVAKCELPGDVSWVEAHTVANPDWAQVQEAKNKFTSALLQHADSGPVEPWVADRYENRMKVEGVLRDDPEDGEEPAGGNPSTNSGEPSEQGKGAGVGRYVADAAAVAASTDAAAFAFATAAGSTWDDSPPLTKVVTSGSGELRETSHGDVVGRNAGEGNKKDKG